MSAVSDGSRWVLDGFQMGFRWVSENLSDEFPMGFGWFSDGFQCHMGFRCPDKFQMGFRWVSEKHPKVLACALLGEWGGPSWPCNGQVRVFLWR